MENVDRRSLLIGSTLALAVAGCAGQSDSGKLGMTAFDPRWNYGDNPLGNHPDNPRFDPEYVVLLHLNINNDFKLEAKRARFPVVRAAGKNDFSTNNGRISEWINYFNSGLNRPNHGGATDATGLKEFWFREPTHFIIYIKNPNIAYGSYPIWFGKSLITAVGGSTTAKKNRSFFNAGPADCGNLVTTGRTGLIYVRNYFHEHGGILVGRRPIKEREACPYSLNINAVIVSAEDPALQIPLIIDPDTGNMGEGAPLFDT